MMTDTGNRSCMLCSKAIKGRTDKKFCDDFCRNAFNNQRKAPSNNFIRKVNNALRRNRYIMENLLDKKKEKKVHRETLLEHGFFFRYCTHMARDARGNTYTFCYDHGYAALDNDWYVVIRKERI